MPAIPKPDYSLPRQAILRGRSDFDRIFESGSRVGNRELTLLFHLTPVSSPSARVAFLTPKKLGDAHLRNRLRRRLRECYRQHLPSWTQVLAVYPSLDILILAKPASLKLDIIRLNRSLEDVYARLVKQLSSPNPPSDLSGKCP